MLLSRFSQQMNTDRGLPRITQQPVDQTVADGSPATFSLVAENADTYQWSEKAKVTEPFDVSAWELYFGSTSNFSYDTTSLSLEIVTSEAGYKTTDSFKLSNYGIVEFDTLCDAPAGLSNYHVSLHDGTKYIARFANRDTSGGNSVDFIIDGVSTSIANPFTTGDQIHVTYDFRASETIITATDGITVVSQTGNAIALGTSLYWRAYSFGGTLNATNLEYQNDYEAMTGETSNSLIVTAGTGGDPFGTLYKCEVSNVAGSVESNEVKAIEAI